MGFLVIFFQNKGGHSKELQVAVIAGFLGAFTTFSSFVFDIDQLSKQGQQIVALGYILSSVTVGYFVFQLGESFARMFYS